MSSASDIELGRLDNIAEGSSSQVEFYASDEDSGSVDSTSSSLNARRPPKQALEASVAAVESEAGTGIISEVRKTVKKLLESDDNNDVDHLRNTEKVDQIAGNYSTAQQATTQAARAAEAAKAAKAAQ